MNPDSHKGQNLQGSKGQPHDAVSPTFLVQKAEKLATAIYMITDIVDAREPLRWKIRESAMDILSLTGDAKTPDASVRWNVLYRAIQSIDKIEGLLDLSRVAKLMSDMNVSVVKKEYQELKEKIRASGFGDDERSLPKLNQQFFKVESAPEFKEPMLPIRKAFSPISDSPPKTKPLGNRPGVVGTSTGLNVQHKSDVIQKDMKQDPSDKKDDRRKLIVDMLKSKSEVSVSEVLARIPGVSDKTIQRELVAMVEEGVLIKKGEKRWSTYMLPASAAPKSDMGLSIGRPQF